MILDSCSWDNPGVNPYMGEIPAAVEAYKEIPPSDRAAIKLAIEKKRYSDIVLITRNGILGIEPTIEYAPQLTKMHFGNGICNTTTRDKWAKNHVERALVFCSGDYCVAVPTVCRNVSLLTKTKGSIQEYSLPKQRHTTYNVPEPTTYLLALFPIIFLVRKFSK